MTLAASVVGPKCGGGRGLTKGNERRHEDGTNDSWDDRKRRQRRNLMKEWSGKPTEMKSGKHDTETRETQPAKWRIT